MAKAAAKITAPAIDHEAIKREVADKPIILFMDPAKLEAYVAALRADVEENPGDIGTAKGRDIIKSNAAEIGRKKAVFEKERLRSTEEWRSNIATVNAAGKVVKESLQALQDQTRAPLTAWEEREASRRAEAETIVADMKAAVVIQLGDTAADLRDRLERIRSRNLSDEMFGPRIEEVTDLRDETVATLQAAIARVEQEEADRAELTRLREEREQRARDDAARAERERQEAEERAVQERAEQERVERERAAAEAETRRQQEEASRIERERHEAAERAQRQAEAAAQAERERIQREHEEVLAAERRRAEEAERAAQEERDRAARQQTQREAAERAERDAQAAREADRAHRSTIQREVKEAFMSCGVDEETAKKLVLAILAKTVPHTTISF